MSEIRPNTPWSTILRPAPSMPASLHMNGRRAIFLGFTGDHKFVRVIVKPNATPQQYSPDFWQVDDQYMSDRERIAELTGRINESNEPTDVEDYQREIQDIEAGMVQS